MLTRAMLAHVAVVWSVLVVVGPARPCTAQQFQIGLMEISQTAGGGITDSSYIGPNFGAGDRRGAVLDGGSDAYDDAGYYASAFPATLQVSRQTDTLAAINVFRWIDTYSNLGSTTLVLTLLFESNLGSDSLTHVIADEPFRSVTLENRSPASTDPILGMMHGNNAFAQATVAPDLSRLGFLTRRVTITLAPAQSRTFMFADFLARDLTDRSGDQALVLDRTAALLLDPTPLFTGMTPSQSAAVGNWTIPAPGAALPLLAAALIPRRRRAPEPRRTR